MYWLYKSMDAEELLQTQCGKNWVHLAGLGSSSCCLLLWPNRCPWRSRPAITHGPRSGHHHRSSHQFRRPCHQVGKDMLFLDSTASVDSKITDHRVPLCPCLCDGPIATGLFQGTSWRGSKRPTWLVHRCHEGCCTTHPCAPSAESRDQWNSCEATRLHWLDIPSRVQFKLCCLAFRCLHGSAPPYLAGYFTLVSSIEGRSHCVPCTWTVTVGLRAFGVSSPAAWNSLLVDLRDPGLSLLSFRKKLKTYSTYLILLLN